MFFHTGDGGDIFTGARIAEASRLQARLLEISGVRRVALSTIDALAAGGIQLSSYYVMVVCSCVLPALRLALPPADAGRWRTLGAGRRGAA